MDWDEMLGEFNSRSVSNKKRNNMSWLSSLFSGGLGVIGTLIQNAFNVKQQERANKANRELVDLQNEAAAAESDKAYRRSLPVNQVGNMRAAGMSEAGAINALNGGGSYQPAPVNTAQDQAPQIDVTQAINAIQASAQLAEQKRQFNLQHVEQKRQFDESLSLEKDKFQETANQNAAIRNLWHEESERQKVEKKLAELRLELETANKENRISAEKAEYIAREARAELDRIIAQKSKVGYESLSPATIKDLAEIQATLEIMGNFGTMKMKDILDWIHKVLDSLPFS